MKKRVIVGTGLAPSAPHYNERRSKPPPYGTTSTGTAKNDRQSRSRWAEAMLFPVEEHEKLCGYHSSKKRDFYGFKVHLSTASKCIFLRLQSASFYGFKVHLLVTAKSQPVELLLSERCFTISKN